MPLRRYCGYRERRRRLVWVVERERKAESSLAPVSLGTLLKSPSFPHYVCFSFPSRCPIPEGTTPQSEAAGGVTTNTIGAESIRGAEAAPGQAAVIGRGGGGGKTATMSVPGGEALYSASLVELFYLLSSWEEGCSRWRTKGGTCPVV